MATATARPNSHANKAEPTAVPFTRDSLTSLRRLMARFHDLQRPLSEYAIIEIALRRLCNEYYVADDVEATDPDSARLIKKTSLSVLSARWREYETLETVILRKKRTA